MLAEPASPIRAGSQLTGAEPAITALPSDEPDSVGAGSKLVPVCGVRAGVRVGPARFGCRGPDDQRIAPVAPTISASTRSPAISSVRCALDWGGGVGGAEPHGPSSIADPSCPRPPASADIDATRLRSTVEGYETVAVATNPNRVEIDMEGAISSLRVS